MFELWLVGTLLGALIGASHARYLFLRGAPKREMSPALGGSRLVFSASAFTLWILVGPIVLFLWLAACLLFIPARLLGFSSTKLPWNVKSSEIAPIPLRHENSKPNASDYGHVRRVAVIGAGVSGLATARTLVSEGLECVVFERRSSLGGVWADGYLNFGVQVPKNFYEFPDYPIDGDDFTSGPDMQKYLEGYAVKFDVLPKIRFGASVLAIKQLDGKWELSIEDNLTSKIEHFDFVVVCVGLYSETPYVPKFSGIERFKGEVFHVSELKSINQLVGKRVAVVGYGKSASDAAIVAAKWADKTDLIFRHAHWPIPRKLLGVLPFTYGMFHRLVSALIPQYVYPTKLEKILHTLGRPLVWLWWRSVELLLRLQFELGSRFGTRLSLVPQLPIEVGGFGEATMVPKPGFFEAIRDGRIRPHISSIAKFVESQVLLENGEVISTDVVVLGTGWQTDYKFLPPCLKDRLGFEVDGLYLYKHILHPDVPNLAFIGHASTNSCILTSSLQAQWLGDLLLGRFSLPEDEIMRQEISDLKAWKRSWLPNSNQRGARIMLHMLHYHDDLLDDMNLPKLRKRGVFAPVLEIFDPYLPRDYRGIGREREVAERANDRA